MSGEEIAVKHTSQIIYATLPTGVKAYLKYLVEADVMKLIETYTPQEFRGRGIAAKLVDYAINLAREKNWLIEPICSYAVYYFMKNKDKRNILVERYRNMSDEEWRELFEITRAREEKK